MSLRALRFILLVGGFVPPSITSAATVLDEVTVRVYDTATVAAAIRASALSTASTTLATAGASISWRICSVTSISSCASAPHPRELIVRIVPAPSMSVGGANLARLHSSGGLPLGDAFVDVGRSAGVLATVYLDRVTRLALEAGIEIGVLLGYAIAHEIGHLLMASNAHATHGLMRPLWSSRELKRKRVADWMFGEEEITAIRRRLEAARIAEHVVRGTR